MNYDDDGVNDDDDDDGDDDNNDGDDVFVNVFSKKCFFVGL